MLNNKNYRWRGHRKTFVGTKVLWPKRYKVFLPICINPQTSSIFLVIYFCVLPLALLQGAFKCCALTPPVLATSTCYGAQVNPSALPSMRPAIFLNKKQSICLKLTLNRPQAILPTSQKRIKWIQLSSRLYLTPVGLLAPWEGRLQGWVRFLFRNQLQEKLPRVPAPAGPRQNNLNPCGISSMSSDTHGGRRIIELMVWVVFSNCEHMVSFVKLFIRPWLMTQPFSCSPTVMPWEHFNNQTSFSFKRF